MCAKITIYMNLYAKIPISCSTVRVFNFPILLVHFQFFQFSSNHHFWCLKCPSPSVPTQPGEPLCGHAMRRKIYPWWLLAHAVGALGSFSEGYLLREQGSSKLCRPIKANSQAYSVFPFVLFFWQRIRSVFLRSPITVFFDKLCIAQHDEELWLGLGWEIVDKILSCRSPSDDVPFKHVFPYRWGNGMASLDWQDSWTMQMNWRSSGLGSISVVFGLLSGDEKSWKHDEYGILH